MTDGEHEPRPSEPATSPAEAQKHPAAMTSPPSAGLRKGPDAEHKLLEKLQSWFEEKGGTWEPGWAAEVKQRTSGKTTGGVDVYYRSPAGKRYRSKAEIARDFNLAEDNPKSVGAKQSGGSAKKAPKAAAQQACRREQAAQHAQQRLAGVQLPLAAGGGVAVLSLGSLDKRYHDASGLWPVGYSAEWRDSQRGITFVSSIEVGGQAPVFRVTAQKAPPVDGAGATRDPAGTAAAAMDSALAAPVEIGSGASADAAWQAAGQRQQDALDTALARSQARSGKSKTVKPPATVPTAAMQAGAAAAPPPPQAAAEAPEAAATEATLPAAAKAGGAGVAAAAGASGGSTAPVGDQDGHPSQQQQRIDHPEQQQEEEQDCAAGGGADRSPSRQHPAPEALPGKGSQSGTAAGESSAAAAAAAAAAGGGAAAAGGGASIAAMKPVGHGGVVATGNAENVALEAGGAVKQAMAAAAEPMRELGEVDRLLIACPPLAGFWGTERFGLASPAVLQALEGLPGAEACQGYKFVEERGGWEAETQRLAKETAKHTRAAVKVTKEVERKEARLEKAASSGKRKAPAPQPQHAQQQGAEGGEAGATPKAKKPRKSGAGSGAVAAGGSKEARAVHKVLEGIMHKLEVQEAKEQAKRQREAEKEAAKRQRLQEKQQRQQEKQRGKEAKLAKPAQQAKQAAHAPTAGAALPPKASIPLAAVNGGLIDDELLAGASQPPPTPEPITSGKLTPKDEATLLEAWHLGHRFSDLLGLEAAPTLRQLEDSLLAEPQSPLAAPGSGLQLALLEFLVEDLFQNAVEALAESNRDVREADLRPAPKARHPVPINPATFPEAARRVLLLVAAAAAHQAREGGTAGGAQLLQHADPAMVLQFLTAGTPPQLGNGPGMLPRGAASTAAEALSARLHGAALASAERLIAEQAGQSVASGAADTADGAAASVARRERQQGQLEQPVEAAAAGPVGSSAQQGTTRLLRCLLHQVANVKGDRGKRGRTLCFGGAAAATASKWAKPCDLRLVAALVDAGYYAALPDPLEAFKEDVAAVCALFQAACNKHSSEFAADMADKGAPEVAALAMSKLEGALREVAQHGTAAYLAQHAPQRAQHGGQQGPHARLEAERKGGGDEDGWEVDGEQQEGGEERQQQMEEQLGEDGDTTDPINDLDRPLCPFQGCVVCWSDDNRGRNVLCDGCDCEYHTYCAEPPLEDIPQGVWLCPRCLCKRAPGASSGKAGVAGGTLKLHPNGRGAGLSLGSPSCGGEAAYRLAERLGSVELGEWTPGQRCELLGALCTMVADSQALNRHLKAEEEEVREKRREVQSLRQELKRMREEEAAVAQQAKQQQAQQDGKANGQKQEAKLSPRVTRGREQADVEGIVRRISRLDHEISQALPTRLEPLGYDRHWNRYWLLPPEALGGTLGTPASSPGERPPPVLLIERCHAQPHPVHASKGNTSSRQARALAATAEAAEAGSTGGSSAAWEVGLYPPGPPLEQLQGWLNPQGRREKDLAAEVRRLAKQHDSWRRRREEEARLEKERQTAEEQASEQASKQGEGVGITADTRIAGNRGSGDPELPQEEDEQQGRDGVNGAAAPMELDAAVPTVPKQCVSALSALAEELLQLEEGLLEAALSPLLASEPRMKAWRSAVLAAGQPQLLMAALLVLEGFVRPEWVKPHWRPWALPAPEPRAAATLAPVRLRLEAFKGAVRHKAPGRLGVYRELAGAGPGAAAYPHGGGGYAFRERAPPAGKAAAAAAGDAGGGGGGRDKEGGKRRLWEGSRPSESGASSDVGSRAERAAKRAKQHQKQGRSNLGHDPDRVSREQRAAHRSIREHRGDDDATLAKRLDEQLNGPGRLTRLRLRHVGSGHDTHDEDGAQKV